MDPLVTQNWMYIDESRKQANLKVSYNGIEYNLIVTFAEGSSIDDRKGYLSHFTESELNKIVALAEGMGLGKDIKESKTAEKKKLDYLV